MGCMALELLISTRQKRKKRHRDWEARNNLFIHRQWKIVYMENSSTSMRKLLELISELSQGTRYKIQSRSCSSNIA